MTLDEFAKLAEKIIGVKPNKIQGISNIARIMDGVVFLGGPNLQNYAGENYAFCSRLSFSPNTHLFFAVHIDKNNGNQLVEALSKLNQSKINNSKLILDNDGLFISTNSDISSGTFSFKSPEDQRIQANSFLYFLTGNEASANEAIAWIQQRFNGDSIPIGQSTSASYPAGLATSKGATLPKYLPFLTKPFVILAGLSGTGKSRMVRDFAFDFCPQFPELRTSSVYPGNFQLVEVKPNWHDSSELLGYVSRLSQPPQYVVPAFVTFLIKAHLYNTPSLLTPFFLCLDEMNLAPVEHYLAEYLSVLETRKTNDAGNSTISAPLIPSDWLNTGSASIRKSLGLTLDSIKGNPSQEHLQKLSQRMDDLWIEFSTTGIGLPGNLFIVGTVNMDETTHSFSRKVLDRSLSIEMNEVNLEKSLTREIELSYREHPIPPNHIIGNITSGWQAVELLGGTDDKVVKQTISFLTSVNEVLEGSPFKIAYRTRDEFLIYISHAAQIDKKPADWLEAALDELFLMRILPRIEGDEERVGSILNQLIELLSKSPKSIAKLQWMRSKLESSHYTSYWP